MVVDITKQTFKAVDRYFKILSATGHVSKNASDRLMALMFLEDMLTGDMSQLLTENDLNLIKSVLFCVSDGCMIGDIKPNDSSCQNTQTTYVSSNNCIVSTKS